MLVRESNKLRQSHQHGFMYWGPARDDDEALERLSAYHPFIAVDTETIALKGDKTVVLDDWDFTLDKMVSTKTKMDARTCIGIGIAVSEHEAWYFPLGRNGWKNVPMCSAIYACFLKLSDERTTKVFFNAMFDLDRLDDAFDGFHIANFDDVAIASQVQGLWNSLDQNSGHLLMEDHTIIDEVMPKTRGATMLDVSYPTTAWKCICDCLTTLKLYTMERLNEWQTAPPFVWTDRMGRQFDVTRRIADCYYIDKANIQILRKMSKRGIDLHQSIVNDLNKELVGEIQVYTDFFKQQGINPFSNDQVGTLMHRRGYYVPLTETGKHYTASEEFLLAVRDPVAHMVLAVRRRNKLRSTYVAKMLGREVAYTHFRLDLATGRLGSYDFNSQNLPPGMRRMFRARNGKWRWMDLHQAEMRVWANQAKDEVMLKAFAENSSPHVATLHYLFPGVAKNNSDGSSTVQYVDSKSFNFALLADASDDVLARTTKRPVHVVKKLKAELYALYWKSREHQNYMRQKHSTSYIYPEYVEDDYGRRMHIPEISLITNETHREKCRLNYPFQGTVASAVKRQMFILDNMGYDFPFQVHDEIVQDGVAPWPQLLEEVHPQILLPFEDSMPQEYWI